MTNCQKLVEGAAQNCRKLKLQNWKNQIRWKSQSPLEWRKLPFFFMHRQNITHKLKRVNLNRLIIYADGWGGETFIPQRVHSFFEKDILNFTILQIHCRIQKCIIEYKNMHLTSAKTENLSTNFVFKAFET